MIDYRAEVIKLVEESLISKLQEQEKDIVINELLKILKDYEVTENRRKELINYIDINGNILKRFCASLLIEGKSEKTIGQYKRTAEKLFEATQKHFTEVGVYDIRLFLAFEKQRGVSNVTLENTRANLSAFFQWMANEEIIPKNPCAKINVIKHTEKIKLPFSSVEIDALRIGCRNVKERALVELLLSSGVRASELTSMKIKDIDFNNMSIHVVNGKGAKERTTFLNDLARTHLIKYLEARGNLGEYVFYNKNHKPISTSGVRFILNEIADRVKVENVHPHRFRRTFASSLANRGMNVQEIKVLMGHSNINTTMKYVYTSDSHIQNSYKRHSI